MYFDDCKNPEELGKLVNEVLSKVLEDNVLSPELLEKLCPRGQRGWNHPTSTPLYLITLANKARERILCFRSENKKLPPMPKQTNNEHFEPHKTLQEIYEWCIDAQEPAETEQDTTPAKPDKESWPWKLYEKTLGAIIGAILGYFFPKQ